MFHMPCFNEQNKTVLACNTVLLHSDINNLHELWQTYTSIISWVQHSFQNCPKYYPGYNTSLSSYLMPLLKWLATIKTTKEANMWGLTHGLINTEWITTQYNGWNTQDLLSACNFSVSAVYLIALNAETIKIT